MLILGLGLRAILQQGHLKPSNLKKTQQQEHHLKPFS